MECQHKTQVTYSEFSERIYKKLISKRIPFDGSLELTLRCNLRCVHCYCKPDVSKQEMSYVQVTRVLDEIADAGCFWLLLTGGEPLLRDDFTKIYTYAKKKGMMITLFTNATLLTPYLADFFNDLPPYAIEISLYGATEATYERICRVPGSFDRCRRGIELLLGKGLKVRLKTMVMTLNRHEFFAIENFAKSRELEFRLDAALNSKMNRDKNPCNLRISPEEVVRLDLSEPKRVESWKSFFKRYGDFKKADKLYVCSAGITAFHIDPYGNLSPCIMARYPAYNVLSGTFKEGWNSFIKEVISQKASRNNRCVNCKLQAICNQCPGWSYFEHGDLETPVEYLCQVAKERAKAFDKQEKGSEVLSFTADKAG